MRKNLREVETSLEDVKREALKRFGWRRSLRGYAALRRLGAAMSCL